MGGQGFKDHFSGTAQGYAAHRPTYPDALVDFLAGQVPGHDLVLDCGCGSGQLSTLLAARFALVVATDASAQQIAAATPHPRVEYQVAPADRSGLPDGSADLITAAQAAHWFDLPAFYAEVRRVARPGAVLALISYGILELDGPAGSAMQRFYRDTLESYWPPERRLVEEGYRSLPFPFGEFTAPPLAIEVAWRLDDLIGYVGTWSAVQRARAALGQDPIAPFRAELLPAWGDPETCRPIRFPLSLRVGRV
ncbi:class I SAM-dependent methyltransferase [Geminicoccus flavidas]|uniref:class I SAM-dependent methyltransferase n=1 Tax=Geminicoccus flavidas TaxID=2506407 RepID=UPI00135693C9|nr:class I SAM-dependent methyltransferase [Geminicoccus flavidas]